MYENEKFTKTDSQLPIDPDTWAHGLHNETILICGLHAVYMKTVFMLNALFFPQDKIYSVLRLFFCFFFCLIQKNKILCILWPMLLLSARTLNNLKIDETIDNIFFYSDTNLSEKFARVRLLSHRDFKLFFMAENYAALQLLRRFWPAKQNRNTISQSYVPLSTSDHMFFFIDKIYYNICPKSRKGSSRQLTLFTFNILKIQMHVKIEHTRTKKRKNKKNKLNKK